MIPLGLLTPGEHGVIHTVRVNFEEMSCGDDCGCGGKSGGCGHGHKGNGGSSGNGCSGRVQGMGLSVGKTVRMLANNPGLPILVKVGESRLAVDRGVAMKIIVRRCD